MIVYKCDGSTFEGNIKCTREVEHGDSPPKYWLTMSGVIKNGLHNAHLIEGNSTWHFCSRQCFENFLFKNEPPKPVNT